MAISVLSRTIDTDNNTSQITAPNDEVLYRNKFAKRQDEWSAIKSIIIAEHLPKFLSHTTSVILFGMAECKTQ